MQFEFVFPPRTRSNPRGTHLYAGDKLVPLHFVRHRRARRYILRILHDGSARVTLPRWGTLAQANEFARANTSWITEQLIKQARKTEEDTRWRAGTLVYFRGAPVPLEVNANCLRLGEQSWPIGSASDESDLKSFVQRYLRALAVRELPARVHELATAHGLSIHRVSIGNQRSRWGSCSRRGTISLNWRLVQAPDFVRDYIILHELAHLRHMNHSRRFWAEVSRMCPGFKAAECWLKQHSKLLR